MLLTRRKLLASAAALGGAAVFARPALADNGNSDGGDSIWDILARSARMKSVDKDKNTDAALSIIDTSEPILSFDTAANIQERIAYYQQVVQAGGWQPPSRQMFGLSVGKDGHAVIDLKRFLITVGDMENAKVVDEHFDDACDLGVRRFQVRHGIIPTGKIDELTFYALQVPADKRLAQLQINLQRVQEGAGKLTADR